MAKFTFIDLFAGCGGLSEGFLSTGKFKSLAHVEWEMPMVESLRNRLVKKWGYSELEAKRDVIHFDIQKTDELLMVIGLRILSTYMVQQTTQISA